VIRADRAGPVTLLGLQRHQRAVPGLLQRPQVDPAPRRGQRRGGFARSPADEVAEFHALAFQLGACFEEPLVVHPWQQFAAVERDGPVRVREHGFGVVPGQCGPALEVERPDVDPARRGIKPAEVLRGDDEGGLVAQHAPEVVQLAAEVGEGLGIGGIRPEQRGDALTCLRQPGVHGEQRHERDRARRPGQDRSGRIVENGLLTQERDVQHRVARLSRDDEAG